MSLQIIYKDFDSQAFERFFKEHFVALCAFANKYIRNTDSSKEIVHDVFINVWEKRQSMVEERSVKSYLYTSVKNRCLNYLRDNRKFNKSSDAAELRDEIGDNHHEEMMEAAELESRIDLVIRQLPDKCREVFVLSRFEEKKYSEIAEKLNLSVKTVEAHMSKALKVLKDKLADYFMLLVLLLLRYFTDKLIG